MSRMRILSVWVPEKIVEVLDALVEAGRYPSRAEAVRAALKDFIREELKTMELEQDRLWGRKYADY